MPKNIKKCNLENPSLNQPLRLRYMSKLKESNTKNPKTQNKKKRKSFIVSLAFLTMSLALSN
ncbi:MAG: hypothetical protein ACI9W7_001428 [Porticoccaceae bacterium]|jgi:hypothetical protein